MDFLLWATRTMHLFAVVLWLGSLLYMAVLVFPGWRAQDPTAHTIAPQLALFVPFQWMSLMTILVSGTGMMLFDPRFVFFSYADWWSTALGFKQVFFVAIVVFSFGCARMASNAVSDKNNAEAKELYCARLILFFRINLFFGIVSLLLAASMS
jgi:uncharacterized membrane protein